MAIFKSKGTTEGIHIGIPEAEAEANIRARVKLVEVFSDYLEVIPEIKTEKFIVVGRKGSGKTAIGQYLYQTSKQSPNIFCDFIRKSDIDLEYLVQVSKETGNELEKELIYKWIVLIRILKLIVGNVAVENVREIKLLKRFLDKNSGYVQLDRFEIKELIKTGGFTIYVENLTRFLRGSGNKSTKISSQKAPFYKLIPSLEQAIISILTSLEDEHNSYLLIFDDLDIEFKANKDQSVESLLNLIRITKHYNNNVFANNNISAKILLLLRDDISQILIKRSADMAKVFSSYSIPLIWYEHDLFKKDENLLKLKQFIDSRIKKAFIKKGVKIESNPWKYLIRASQEVSQTSFKYIIDHTFYSPRDLLLFMKPLDKYKFKIPLSKANLNVLIGKYAEEAKNEIDNALAIYLNHAEIGRIWKVLNETNKESEFNYTYLIKLIEEQHFSYDAHFIALLMFEYSLIGNKKTNSNVVEFKYREEITENYKLNPKFSQINHRIVSVYCKNHDI